MQITAFADSGQAMGTIETARSAFDVGRVSDHHLVMFRQSTSMAAVGTRPDDTDVPEAGEHETSGFGAGRNRGLGALVERWYFPSPGHNGCAERGP